MTFAEKRLISFFKTFVEKVFVPQFSKINSKSEKQWNKFNNLLSMDTINYAEVQLYIDALSLTSKNNQRRNQFFNKSPNIIKVTKRQSTNDNSKELSGGFNPSKTFGGNRNRPPVFPLKDQTDEVRQQVINNSGQKNQIFKEDRMLSTQSIMPSLQRLYRFFGENQQKISKIETSGNFRQVKNFIS